MRRSVWSGTAVCAAWLVLVLLPAGALAGGFIATSVWGEPGRGIGRLTEPKGVAVTSDGSVFVVDYTNQSLLKYSPAGELLDAWGGRGSAPGKFDRPSRVAVGPDDTVYVTDAANHRIQRFSPSGRLLGRWGTVGHGPGELCFPRGVDVGPDGTVYVAVQGNHRVEVFTARGRFLRQWGAPGSGRGKFKAPKDVAVSDDGRVYVVDAKTDRVQVFTTRGRWLASFGGHGSARGRLDGPRGLCVDGRGHVFVADAMNHRIQEFSRAGKFVREWGCTGGLLGQLRAPRDVAPAPDGSLVVADTFNQRLERFVRDLSSDDQAPLTQCAPRSGWTSAPLQVTLAALDSASGVAATYASVDAPRFDLYGGPFVLRTQGRHVVRYLSVDAAGNQEVMRRRVFRLDWTAPRIGISGAAPLRTNPGATLRLRCTIADAICRRCRIRARLERGGEVVLVRAFGEKRVSRSGRLVSLTLRSPSVAGRYVLTVTARDRAGNVGSSSIDLRVLGG